ncbi:Neuroendocrine convertase 1, partial [Paramuricea clavata]
MVVGNRISSAVSLLLLCLSFLFYDKLSRKDRTVCEGNSIVNPPCVGKTLEIQSQGIYTVRRAKDRHGRRFLSGKILYTTNGISTFNMERKLLTCGDVSPNPGPKGSNSKYYCRECRKKVRRNQNAIICTDCEARFHAKCLKISSWTNKNNTIQSNNDWVCTMCALPNFSDSLFENNHCELTTPEIADSETNNKSILTDNLKQLRDANHQKCLIASLNVNSLPNKFVEIKEWLRCGVFDILSIQETKIDKTFPNFRFYVEGFKYFRRDRKKGGGGIIVYIKESIIAQQKKIACKQLETILLQLRIGQRQFALISAYKPPSVDNSAFTTELSMVLDEAFLLSENIVCTGDLNSDLLQPLSNNKQGKFLLDICDICDLDSLINKPTRVSENRSSCLD